MLRAPPGCLREASREHFMSQKLRLEICVFFCVRTDPQNKQNLNTFYRANSGFGADSGLSQNAMKTTLKTQINEIKK